MNKATSRPIPKRASTFSLQPFFIIGLPVLLSLGILLSLLFSPLRTVQQKGNKQIPLAVNPITQSFRAEHTNLSKISLKFVKLDEASGNASVNVSLRRGTIDGPIIGQWTGAVQVAQEQAYVFTSQSDSVSQLYFLSVSSQSSGLGLAQSGEEGYLPGQLFVNGQATAGDLFFIAEYDPNPAELFRNFFERQHRFGGLPELALVCLMLALGLTGVLLGLLNRYRGELKERLRQGKAWLVFGGLLLGLRLLLSLSFMLITPPLQGPDEPGHIGRAIGMAEGQSGKAYAVPVAQLMERTRFIESFPWLTYADEPVQLYPPDAEGLQLPFYYYLAAGLVKLGGVFGADFAGQNYLGRLTSVLLGLVTVAASLGLGYLWRQEATGLALSLPLSVALLPEAIHLSSVANNDNGAIAFGAVAAWGIALLFKRGLYPLYFAIFGLGLALSIYSKASANALLPGYLIALYILAWLYFKNRWLRYGLLFLPVVGLVLVLLILFLLTDHSRAASAWYYTPTSTVGRHAEREKISGTQAHSGDYVLRLGPEDKSIEQQLNLFNRADFQRVRVSGWLRAAEGASQVALVRVQTASATLIEQPVMGNSSGWTAFDFEVDANAAEISHTRLRAYLRLQIGTATPGSKFYLDDLSLAPADNPRLNLLANPSLEESVWTWQSDWRGSGRKQRSFASDMLDAAQNGAALDYGTIFVQNLLFLFITFWGAFGWSQILLIGPVYLVGAILFLAALLGLLRWQFRAGEKAFGLFCFCSVLTTLFALQFIRLPTSWMYDGTPDITHSRHAFAGLLPQLFLLLLGLGGLQIGPKIVRSAIISQENQIVGSNPGEWVWVWLWSVFLFSLSLLALVGTIFPFYYNS